MISNDHDFMISEPIILISCTEPISLISCIKSIKFLSCAFQARMSKTLSSARRPWIGAGGSADEARAPRGYNPTQPASGPMMWPPSSRALSTPWAKARPSTTAC